jgi:glycosyltransferase involved in cell wall biosynthesis
MAVDERLGDRLRFAGRVPEKDLPAYYQAADVFVLPTEALEGFGMVTAEALASGLPVIGTPVGATPEILSRLGAEWITADPSASAIAEKIRERLDWLANHSADLRTLRGKCRHIAEVYYSWPGILQRWKKVCEDCLPHR